MEIYLPKKGFARKINNLTDFLFNKTEVKYQKIIMLWKKKFQDFSRTFPLFFSFPGLFFQDSIGFQDFPRPVATLTGRSFTRKEKKEQLKKKSL